MIQHLYSCLVIDLIRIRRMDHEYVFFFFYILLSVLRPLKFFVLQLFVEGPQTLVLKDYDDKM